MSKNISDCALFVVFMYIKTTSAAHFSRFNFFAKSEKNRPIFREKCDKLRKIRFAIIEPTFCSPIMTNQMQYLLNNVKKCYLIRYLIISTCNWYSNYLMKDFKILAIIGNSWRHIGGIAISIEKYFVKSILEKVVFTEFMFNCLL